LWERTSFGLLLVVVVPFVRLRGFVPVVLTGFLANLMAVTVVVVAFVVVRSRWAPGEECKRENPRNARHV